MGIETKPAQKEKTRARRKPGNKAGRQRPRQGQISAPECSIDDLSLDIMEGSSDCIKILDLEGRNQRFPVNHPIVTKEMIPTPDSSNVYAYSYDLDTRTLHVRFQSAVKNSSGPGSLYAYANVPPK